MQNYKINLHAHTFFSDGSNSPYRMALIAKELGFTALVLTDHFCTDTNAWCSINFEKMKLLKRAAEEAKEIIPVIIGIELAIAGEEVLVFGSAMVNNILNAEDNGNDLSVNLLRGWKSKFESAFILCHPGREENWKKLMPILDGFEEYNGGVNCFDSNRDFGCLSGLPRWCNSDAHTDFLLEKGYNIVDSKITVESDLIRYIKRKKQPEFYTYKENL